MVPVDERFTQALQGGARAWRAALERYLKSCGITPAGWNALAAVAGAAQAPSQRQLAEQLGVDGATLVATIDRLVAGGLAERMPSPHDRRVKLVVLTTEGRALAAKVGEQAALLRRSIAARIDAARMATASEVLEELQQVLEGA
ncbi:MarR family winged helix-turn-helix transcriptional regulator [Herbaspirillum sp. SJZ107]|uniref:MarR family winged helix-turn-helix transcriptional regulator n=1 Tax=Herbaspirillum sp. SJZ107 TaxID=2572881 RepID=UPI001174E145|nr:MarR family transcriptional regulator [Herbaspirillum sp. SJZ107]TQK07965.1 MarR family transcriptional regulator for hemolysin [Herbaspirillum sp. SJZ107]